MAGMTKSELFSTATFDFARLKEALERSNAAAIGDFYGDEAEMSVVDRDRPPSSPLRLQGKAAIVAFWEDVCGRDMTHRIEEEVVGPDRIAFVESCQYPDGCRVLAATTLDIQGGRIVRHLTVQAWDPAATAEAA